ncbi:hypothetical protein DPM19_33945 [Actinomadura craniellae]|uniref:Uncharacterized protein n=1 Tax=Actinomadura craniellae TaxID=2231787 RepID=A0A365GVF5_9ACTN|nr:hypothetical protein [Actinomadura craniellae]RAY10796.1 hypothetical protein DPM19_33945 [Actinomadura craniellae]
MIEMLFEQVGEVVRGSAPHELGEPRLQARNSGIKVWYGDRSPAAREHYEAQVIGADIVTAARASALEIGFHAEHPKQDDNVAALAALRAREDRWRPGLGDDAVCGAFLGRDTWRRISETWLDPDLDDLDAAFEIGVRLVDYIRALEPHRRSATDATRPMANTTRPVSGTT